MSRDRQKRRREKSDDGDDEEQLYTRADASLWDDSALVKLWNAQLAKASSTHGSQDQISSAEVTSSASTNSGSSEIIEEVADGHDGRPGTGALSLAHLPKDVRALVQSFYDAGYQAGLYAASSRAQRK